MDLIHCRDERRRVRQVALAHGDDEIGVAKDPHHRHKVSDVLLCSGDFLALQDETGQVLDPHPNLQTWRMMRHYRILKLRQRLHAG